MAQPIYIALFEIKNPSFDPAEFGLSGRQFTLDIIKDNSLSKNINTTAQPVLDGTTRIDNISREPGNISINGMIAEHHFANNTNPYIEPRPRLNTPIIRRKKDISLQGTASRLVVQKNLLEYLRDNAIFLDVYMQNGDVVFRNYVLKRVSFTQDQIGVMGVSLALEEVLMFKEPNNFIINSSIIQGSQDVTYRDVYNSIVFEPASNSREDLEAAVAKLIANLPAGARFVVGGAESNGWAVDKYLAPLPVTVQVTLDATYMHISDAKNSRILNASSDQGSLFKIGAKRDQDINIEVGYVVGTTVGAGETVNSSLTYGNYNYIIYGKDGKIIQKTGNFNYTSTPQPSSYAYSIANMMKKNWAGHEFATAGSQFVLDHYNSFKRAQEKGWSFLRETKSSGWKLLPNLLSNPANGYLFNATFATHGFRLGESGDYKLYYTLIWIHPLFWEAARAKIQNWSDLTSNSFTLGETIYEKP